MWIVQLSMTWDFVVQEKPHDTDTLEATAKKAKVSAVEPAMTSEKEKVH